MFSWLQAIFCSTAILDHNYALNLEINTSDTSKAYENRDFCENVGIPQKSQEAIKTVNKYLDVNQSNSNLLTDFTGKDLNGKCKNVNYDLCNFSSSISEENNLIPQYFTRSPAAKYVSKKQYCTSKQSISDKTCHKTSNSGGNYTAEHSQINSPWNNNKNLLLHKNQNVLIQEQYVNSKSKTFLQKNNNVLVLSKNQNYYLKTNGVNELNDVQTDALFNFDNVLLKNTSKGSYPLNNSYKNDNNEKDKETKPKTNKVSNIQTNGDEIASKSKRKRKTYKTILKNQFTANERELYKKYKNSEKKFRMFFKLTIKNQIPQFIKKLEISNLSDDLKQKSIFALKNLLSFLKTISEIYINTKKKKNKKDFLNSLNLAYNHFIVYAGVSQKLLIFKFICKNLHRIYDGVFFCIPIFDFYEIYRLLFSVDIRFNSFYSRLKKLRDDFKKNDQY